MTFNPEIHHRRSIRLRNYDYASEGAYFVTICVQGREHLFGEIVNEEMALNEAGLIVESVWRDLPRRFPTLELDAFISMPNHIHGIFVINKFVGAGLAPPDLAAPVRRTTLAGGSRAPTVGDIVCVFKSISSIQVNRMLCRSGQSLWQRDYHDRIIRNEQELHGIRDYIVQNPSRWAEDEENQATDQHRG